MYLLSIDVGEKQAQVVIDQAQANTEQKLSNAVDRLLDAIEATQIGAYTENASPTRPPNSKYERTFELRRSSQKLHQKGSLSGEWRTDLDYAPFVLGRASEQAPIHRNRWKSLEEVEQHIEQIGPDIIRQEFME